MDQIIILKTIVSNLLLRKDILSILKIEFNNH
jgi:hypothetical protein